MKIFIPGMSWMKCSTHFYDPHTRLMYDAQVWLYSMPPETKKFLPRANVTQSVDTLLPSNTYRQQHTTRRSEKIRYRKIYFITWPHSYTTLKLIGLCNNPVKGGLLEIAHDDSLLLRTFLSTNVSRREPFGLNRGTRAKYNLRIKMHLIMTWYHALKRSKCKVSV